YLKKKQHHHKDPIMDFLFDYYTFRPSHLRKWSPGFGVLMENAEEGSTSNIAELTFTPEGGYLDLANYTEKRTSSAKWILSLLENSLQKEPSFGCFCMHEWAMVY